MRIAETISGKRIRPLGRGLVRPVDGARLQTLEGHAIIPPTRTLDRRATADEIDRISERRSDREAPDRALAPGSFVDIRA